MPYSFNFLYRVERSISRMAAAWALLPPVALRAATMPSRSRSRRERAAGGSGAASAGTVMLGE
jgi:hypothetical protein